MLTAVDPPARSLRTRIGAYVALTKPRIIELLLVTTVPTMIVAERGLPSLWLVAATVVGGTAAAGGANAMNMVADRDIDKVMKRTRHRPLATGAVTPRAALTFAIALEVAAFALLWATVNLLSAVLAVAACLFYVFVYTLWLKRTSTSNIVIGGAAGRPVLIGWSAVTAPSTERRWSVRRHLLLDAAALRALAIRYRDDYERADVCCRSPASEPPRCASSSTRCSVGPDGAVRAGGGMGHIYVAAALVLGGIFTWYAVRLLREATPGAAMRVFTWSISYITLLFGAMALDQLVRSGV